MTCGTICTFYISSITSRASFISTIITNFFVTTCWKSIFFAFITWSICWIIFVTCITFITISICSITRIKRTSNTITVITFCFWTTFWLGIIWAYCTFSNVWIIFMTCCTIYSKSISFITFRASFISTIITLCFWTT